MAKRSKNWRPDIYDLAAARATVVVQPEQLTAADVDTMPEPAAVELLVAEPAPAYKLTVKSKPAAGSDLYLLGGMIAGAIGGALVGLLKAPAPGEVTREKLVRQARQQIEQVGGRTEEVE